MKKTIIQVELDDTVKDNKLFKSIKEIEISKPLIFKYGILNEDVPKKIKENDFEYLESKIPFLEGLYSDFIELDKSRLISTAENEAAKKISETIGVGVGLYYSTKLLKINPNKIQRIAPPKSKKGKYLDFKVNKNGMQYEIETKGTVNHSKKNSLIADILAKKQDSKNTACKYGVITMANKEDNMNPSKIIVCDDFNNKKSKNIRSFKNFLEYYKLFLSFIMDSTHYNRMVSKIDKGKFTKKMVKLNKAINRYEFNEKIYLGRFFDKRLIMDTIAEYYTEDITLNRLFKLLTKNVGKNKYFLGLDSQVVDFLNSKDVKGLQNYSVESIVKESDKRKLIRDADGVIFVSSIEGGDKQIESNFRETDVKERLSHIVALITNTPHQCGAPCRSKDKEGKPCEKLTFRDHCHFHRD